MSARCFTDVRMRSRYPQALALLLGRDVFPDERDQSERSRERGAKLCGAMLTKRAA